ncbi:hypothetical protein N658DRAFT_425828 [Parathielavia hyrcaniae]|uniref:Aminoglycoside phosphotransferase domain-containing protein n=1 Tax=Parathielavia hyrcaniae TaxID=113614 RepID=A0AAN6Q0K3_9PEZI|nr:hypothetical protein N658DRAFT_425828 [Parathielavia hyrcaniae]
MATTPSEYSVDAEIDEFFQKTSATRAECHARAKELVDGNVVPVPIQGVCSYAVYAGPELEYVVQFRLESLALRDGLSSRVSEVYGSFAPSTSFEGVVGDGEKEPLHVFVMSRVRGITHLDFILRNGYPEDSPDNIRWRRNLIGDVARFMALSWKGVQLVTPEYRSSLRETYLRDLRLLHSALPPRFRPIVQTCIDSMDDIMSLPMVLLHRGFGSCNIMVDENTFHLAGVVDWAEAEVCPFGLNLHSLQKLTGKLHLRNGWVRYVDYDDLQKVFWETFEREIGGLPDDRRQAIKLARVVGLLLSYGFISRLANEPEPTPVGDDERGRYNMLSLDGFPVNPETKFDGLH